MIGDNTYLISLLVWNISSVYSSRPSVGGIVD